MAGSHEFCIFSDYNKPLWLIPIQYMIVNEYYVDTLSDDRDTITLMKYAGLPDGHGCVRRTQ